MTSSSGDRSVVAPSDRSAFVVDRDFTATIVYGLISLRANLNVVCARFLLTEALLVHLLNEDVNVVAHAFEVLTEELVFGLEEFLLLFVVRKVLEYLGCLFHFLDLLFGLG